MTASYTITLPLPTSTNALHTVGKGFKDKKTGKWRRTIRRSDENKAWREAAYYEYRRQFPNFPARITGRIRAEYTFIWHSEDAGRQLSDANNREKILSDFFEHKFYLDDQQIDDTRILRRISPQGENRVICRITEIPDDRFIDMFNPQEPENATS